MKSIFLRCYNRLRFILKFGVSIGKRCLASFSARVIASSGGKVRAGSSLCANRNVTIHSDGGIIDIGNNCFINESAIIASHKEIKIGKNCKIGPHVCIYDHDHDINGGNEYISESVVIGDNVWIGSGVIILRGTKIGNNSVIAAGAIVKGNVPDDTIYIDKRTHTMIKKNKGGGESV